MNIEDISEEELQDIINSDFIVEIDVSNVMEELGYTVLILVL